MTKKPHFKAMLTYRLTEDGGLVTPVSSGFRTSVRFPFAHQDLIANQTFLETELAFPGDTVNADMILFPPYGIWEKLYAGIDFDLTINSNIIGSGVVMEVYR